MVGRRVEGGNEVIFKFLLISYKTSLKKPVLMGPLHYFPYFSFPTLWIPYIFLVSIERYLQGLSQCESYVAHRPFSTSQHWHLLDHSHHPILSIYFPFILYHPNF